MSSNRTITALDKERAANLKRLYNLKKQELGLTHKNIAAEWGITKGAVSNMLNGHMALNFEHLIEWALILDVKISSIDPKTAHKLQELL